MPKKITRVSWSASGLPYGISFDERTGTFSGWPEDKGEYYIPVKVKTNYGSDEKDVKIIVVGKSCPVYAIGHYAETWSERASHDEDGFYPINIPNAYKLSARNNGFTAHVLGDGIYYCGVNAINTTAYEMAYQAFRAQNVPVHITAETASDILCGIIQSAATSTSGTTKSTAYILRISRNGEVKFETSGATIHKANTTTNTYINVSATRSNDISLSELGNAGFKLPEASYQGSANLAQGISWLSGDGSVLMTIKFSNSASSHTYSVSKQELGFKAIKLFAPTNNTNLPFKYLSENKYLDNNPANFQIGVIKDAWVYGTTAYVQTENDNLYEYNSGSWNYQGYYDIEKLEIPASGTVLMLTTDGQLYHKGSQLTNITEAHDNFTPIFTNKKIRDMTLGISYQNTSYQTLTVLIDNE